jgi:CubicO group peptidase (beta-lactamase class C family)
MEKYKVPGALFVMLKNEKVVISKGYGYADLENKIPVSADTTLVRAYAVSNPFTACAVMLLSQEGQIELDADANQYLNNFTINNKFEQPVTIRHLLTHTAGFVDTGEETLLARGEIRDMTLENYLKKYLPPVTSEPGTVMQYSNFGFTLLGYIVERISGMAYEKYMQQKVLDKLKMNNSSFLWPSQLPVMDRKKVAVGYYYENGNRKRMEEKEGDFANTPAANLLTTGADMAKFIKVHLHAYKTGGNNFIYQALIKKMHKPNEAGSAFQYTGYGFFCPPDKYTRRIFHGGGWLGSISDMELFPEHDMGYFMWYDHGDDLKRNMRSEFNTQFINHFFNKGK